MIVSLGSVQTSDHECMLILRQSAATSAANSCALGVVPIRFTLSQCCPELLPKLN
jgi:hypothetical protein